MSGLLFTVISYNDNSYKVCLPRRQVFPPALSVALHPEALLCARVVHHYWYTTYKCSSIKPVLLYRSTQRHSSIGRVSLSSEGLNVGEHTVDYKTVTTSSDRFVGAIPRHTSRGFDAPRVVFTAPDGGHRHPRPSMHHRTATTATPSRRRHRHRHLGFFSRGRRWFRRHAESPPRTLLPDDGGGG